MRNNKKIKKDDHDWYQHKFDHLTNLRPFKSMAFLTELSALWKKIDFLLEIKDHDVTLMPKARDVFIHGIDDLIKHQGLFEKCFESLLIKEEVDNNTSYKTWEWNASTAHQ